MLGQVLYALNAIAIVSGAMIMILLIKNLLEGQSTDVMKLAPLSDSDSSGYLVQLSYCKPNKYFDWPLYLYRRMTVNVVKVYMTEIDSITWKKTEGCWSVKLANDVTLKGLSTVEQFIKMKNNHL